MTRKSVEHWEKKEFNQSFCLTTGDKGGSSNSVAQQLYAIITKSQAQQEKIARILFQRQQQLPIFLLLFKFPASATKVNVYPRREKGLVFTTQRAGPNTFSFSFSFGTSRGGG